MNPGTDFVPEPGDDAVVVAESLGTLEMADITVTSRTSAAVAASSA